MGKSLGLSSNGLSFNRFMRALIQVPKEEIDKSLAYQKKSRKKKAEKRRD